LEEMLLLHNRTLCGNPLDGHPLSPGVLPAAFHGDATLVDGIVALNGLPMLAFVPLEDPFRNG